MNSNICTQCKSAEKKLFRAKYCYICFSQLRCESRLKEIEGEFKAAAPFNDQIFQLYLTDLRSGPIKRHDVVVAKGLANALSKDPIAEIRSWSEAQALSKRLIIHYTVRPKIVCPVLRTASQLEEQGKIAPRVHELAKRYDDVLWMIDPETRKRLDVYFEEISFGQKSPRTALRSVSAIRRLYRFLKGRGLFEVNSDTARAFFDSIDPSTRSGVTIGGLHLELKRFYSWCVKEGLCPENPFENWRPKYLERTCEKCGKKTTRGGPDRLCDTCYVYSRQTKHFDNLVAAYRAPSPYNQHLFDLYVKYCKRFEIVAAQVHATRALTEFLESRPLPAIRSWATVLTLSEELAQKQTRPIQHGCPLVKIGRMLQELGVLPIRQTDKDNLIEILLADCPDDTSRILRQYNEHMKKKSYATISRHGTVRSIVEFQYWLTEHEPKLGLFTLNRWTVEKYLDSLSDADRSGIRRFKLKRFYRWARWVNLTLMDPMKGIPLPNPAKHLCVCTDTQIHQLEAYVKKPESEPEYALILTLVLFWGFSMVDLAMASIEIHDWQITLVLHCKPLTRGRTSHYRDQTIKLPLDPHWLAALQKRYLQIWQTRFEQARKNFPLQPLFLGRNAITRSNRPLHSLTVARLFYEAVTVATGMRIPPNVVRRTSGHIHVDNGDASRLAKLGWAKSHCHDFSFKPRTYFQPKKPS